MAQNAKNALQEFTAEKRWQLPVYTELRTVGTFQFKVELHVEETEQVMEAVGNPCTRKTDAQISAAAKLLVVIVENLAERVSGVQLAPDYELPMEQLLYSAMQVDFVSQLNLLCQKRGWSHTLRFKRMPILQQPTAAGCVAAAAVPQTCLATFVHVKANGKDFWSKSERVVAKEARQEASARLLLFLAASGVITLEAVPQQLQLP